MAEEIPKKRKRQSNGNTAAPNKKAAIDHHAAAGNVKVTNVIHERGLRPIIASAPGLAPSSIAFKAYCDSKNKSDVVLHSSQHPRLDYTALPNTLDSGLSHYIAVFDPQAETLQIMPANHLNLRGTVRAEEQEVEAAARGITGAKQREELGREFGTKKAKKAIASKTENAITKDAKGKGNITATQTAILESVGTATADQASRLDQERALLAAKPIPPPNLDAANVEDVYPLVTLLPPHEAKLVNIKEWQEATISEEDEKKIEFVHSFPAYRVAAIGKAQDGDRLKALRYLNLLLLFHEALGGGRVKKVPPKDKLKEKFSDYPMSLVDSVRRRFTNDSGNELGKFQLDKLYTHICALSLFVDNWSTHITDLKNDLKMDTAVLAKYYQELGCVVRAPSEPERAKMKITKEAAKASRIAKLRLPLQFPKVSRRRV
jgi:DNA-directed RNA polymerase I subunit RPA49